MRPVLAALTGLLLTAAPAAADCSTTACHKRVAAKKAKARAACDSKACKRRTCTARSCVRRVRARAANTGRAALASWYGPGFYGNTTACGQTYTETIVGVAHKTLPCGTRVRVCYRGCQTGRVIDRGPYSDAREFDLSAALARAVGFGGVDTIRVTVG